MADSAAAAAVFSSIAQFASILQQQLKSFAQKVTEPQHDILQKRKAGNLITTTTPKQTNQKKTLL
jgi:hypothetical protein